MSDSTCPMLLLTAPDEAHVFDRYLREALLTEGYQAHVVHEGRVAQADLSPYALVIVSAGAAARLCVADVARYVQGGGRLIAFGPPADWGPLFGLQRLEGNYTTARDAYLQVDEGHPWMLGFPWADLQAPGEYQMWANESAEPLVWTAGQLGCRSVYPAVAVKHHEGGGAAALFASDLAEVLVLLQQGRPELASTGPDPDSNRDGKFCPDDAFLGQRDFRLRHVPQADLHRDLLVRVIRGLTADGPPLPRLWHFPHAAPALLFVDGDGDAMVWEDLEWVVRTVEEFGAKFTFYLMDEQIAGFDAAAVREVFARGHDFGPHPWPGFKPTPEAHATEFGAIVGRFRRKFGLEPVALRTHCVIFAGWDETPRAEAAAGLRLDTNFCTGFRFQSGFLNSSALLVRFADRRGGLLDCWEQSTVQIEDGAASPKSLVPMQSEAEALALSLELLDALATKYHGVFHPYFHPINLGGRGAVKCDEWFRGVLRRARDLGLPSVNAREWLAFHEARHEVTIRDHRWDAAAKALSFVVSAPEAIAALTLLLPTCCGGPPAAATVNGEPADLQPTTLEQAGWTALVLDLNAGSSVPITVRY
jgi:hypothetical protein